jgi:hypothetical protein
LNTFGAAGHHHRKQFRQHRCVSDIKIQLCSIAAPLAFTSMGVKHLITTPYHKYQIYNPNPREWANLE